MIHLPRAGHSRPAYAFIFVTVVLDVLALGMIIPVLPQLVLQFLNGNTVRAAHMYGTFGAVWALAQFACSPLMGSLSDRYGRRRVILLSCFGLGADYLLMAVAPSLTWLLVGRVISGITAANTTTAGAYVADVSDAKDRAGGFGLIGAAWGLGFILGPAFGGLLGSFGPRVPFWAAAVLALLNAAYGFFVLPESLPVEQRTPTLSWRRANPLGALVLLTRQPALLSIVAVYVLYCIAHQVLPSTWALYSQYRYHWDSSTLGLTLGLIGLCSFIVQSMLVKRAVRLWGERRSAWMGLSFGAAGFALMGLAPTGLLFCTAMPLLGLMGFFGPAAQSLMTQRVPADQQGRLQGALSSLMGLSGIIGPPLFTETFAHFIEPSRGSMIPGAPFLLASMLMVLGLMLMLPRQTRPSLPLDPEALPPA
jgi:DHA1 family tetracycline resistance protein-like MFS transporter